MILSPKVTFPDSNDHNLKKYYDSWFKTNCKRFSVKNWSRKTQSHVITHFFYLNNEKLRKGVFSRKKLKSHLFTFWVLPYIYPIYIPQYLRSRLLRGETSWLWVLTVYDSEFSSSISSQSEPPSTWSSRRLASYIYWLKYFDIPTITFEYVMYMLRIYYTYTG